MSLIFSEGVPKWSGNLSNRSRTIWPTYPARYLRRSLLLLPGLRVSYWSSSGTCFWGLLLVPQFPMMKGAPKFSEGLLCSISRSLLTAFLFPCLMTEKVSTCFRSSQSFPIFLGVLQSSQKDFSATASDFSGSLHLCSVFLVLWRRRCQCNVSLLSDRIFGLVVFSHVLWGGEDKIKLIQEVVSNALLFFIYNGWDYWMNHHVLETGFGSISHTSWRN